MASAAPTTHVEDTRAGAPVGALTPGVAIADAGVAVGTSLPLEMQMSLPFAIDAQQYAEALATADPAAIHKLEHLRQAYYINAVNPGFVHAPMTWMTPQMAPFVGGVPMPAVAAPALAPDAPPGEPPAAKRQELADGSTLEHAHGKALLGGGVQDGGLPRVPQPSGAVQQGGDKFSVDSLKMRERKRLEQNREAAKRFRQKKKGLMQDLSMKTEQLEAENTRLRQEYAALLKQAAASGQQFDVSMPSQALPASVVHVHAWWDQLLHMNTRFKSETVVAADACEELKGHLSQYVNLLQKALNDGCASHLVNQDHCPHPFRMMLWLGFFRPTECIDSILSQMSVGPISVQLQAMRQQFEGQESHVEAAVAASVEQVKHQIGEQLVKGAPSVAMHFVNIMASQIMQAAQTHCMYVAQLQDMLEPQDCLRALVIPVDCLSVFRNAMTLAAQQPPTNLVLSAAATDPALAYRVFDPAAAGGKAPPGAAVAAVAPEELLAQMHQQQQLVHALAEGQAAGLDAAQHLAAAAHAVGVPDGAATPPQPRQ